MILFWTIVVSLISFIFIMLMFLVIAVIMTLIDNVGKDEFKWYAMSLNNSTGKTICFDSFKDLMKFGLSMTLKMMAVMFVIVLAVCIYYQIKGW